MLKETKRKNKIKAKEGRKEKITKKKYIEDSDKKVKVNNEKMCKEENELKKK